MASLGLNELKDGILVFDLRKCIGWRRLCYDTIISIIYFISITLLPNNFIDIKITLIGGIWILGNTYTWWLFFWKDMNYEKHVGTKIREEIQLNSNF